MKKAILVLFIILFSGISSFGQNEFVALDTLGNYGIIDKSNKILVDFDYRYISRNGYYIVVTDKYHKQGVLSSDSKEILPCKFESINTCCGDCSDWIVAKKNGLFGYYDSTGNLMIPHQFSEADIFTGDSALVLYKDEYAIKYVWIGRNGKIIRDCRPEENCHGNHKCIRGSVSKVIAGKRKRKNKYGIRQKGKWLLEPVYDSIIWTLDGLFLVKKDNLWGLFDKNGLMIVPIKYKIIREYY